MELVYILVLETRFYRFESCIGHSTGRSGKVCIKLYSFIWTSEVLQMVQFLNSGEVGILHKCRSAQIGKGVCLKNRYLCRFESDLRYWILYPNICRIGLMVRQEIPNLLMWVRFLHPVPCPGNSVEECFATNEEDGGSNPSQGAWQTLKSLLLYKEIEVKSLLYPYEIYHT